MNIHSRKIGFDIGEHEPSTIMYFYLLIVRFRNDYKYEDVINTFNKIKDSIILIQIYNNKIYYLEKKGIESRSQSVIDLIIKTKYYKTINNCLFLVYTGDYLKNNELIDLPFLVTFRKKVNEKISLFPDYSFNHWKEVQNGYYNNLYKFITKEEYKWEIKEVVTIRVIIVLMSVKKDMEVHTHL